MLTVDYERLGLCAGELVLDMGAGAGRHAFESLRRGARIVALDHSEEELQGVRALFAAMVEAGEAPAGTLGAVVRGDATRLPFPDATFDRIIASEVLEHIDSDMTAIGELVRVLRPGGRIAVTVPAWLAERICWALSDDYHAPAVPGGHVRIYRKAELTQKLAAAGLDVEGSHHAHALHSPYWWLRCAVGPQDDDNPLVRAYHKLLVWDMVRHPLPLRLVDRALNPVLGKSIVLYATRPAPARPDAAPRDEQSARKDPSYAHA